MMKLKDKMTAVELAKCLGVTRQTINRWIREQAWRTEKIPGVKGGRARYIIIDKSVRDYLANAPKIDLLPTDSQLAEPTAHYFVNDADIIWRKITAILHAMNAEELQGLWDFLAREGLKGFLSRLDIHQ
ncbi:putative DNA-binding transcriptional regulator [Enterobacteriaceae bacterium ESL0689]|nr:putative DNA-binding transcriptional regulator [Enterobacteriaceae bacterium ESL0689]